MGILADLADFSEKSATSVRSVGILTDLANIADKWARSVTSVRIPSDLAENGRCRRGQWEFSPISPENGRVREIGEVGKYSKFAV